MNGTQILTEVQAALMSAYEAILEGLNSADITPDQKERLEKAEDEIASIMVEVRKQNEEKMEEV